MSEDDTFKKLKQIPFKEMNEKFLEACRTGKLTTINFDEWFGQYGWDADEFNIALIEKMGVKQI